MGLARAGLVLSGGFLLPAGWMVAVLFRDVATADGGHAGMFWVGVVVAHLGAVLLLMWAVATAVLIGLREHGTAPTPASRPTEAGGRSPIAEAP